MNDRARGQDTSKQFIEPAGLAPSPLYTHVIRAGNTVYVSGQVALDEAGNLVGPGDISAQAERAFHNLKIALEAAGAKLSDVVKDTILITDARFRDQMREVRMRYFQPPRPTSTLIVVAGLADPELLIEVEAVAYIG